MPRISRRTTRKAKRKITEVCRKCANSHVTRALFVLPGEHPATKGGQFSFSGVVEGIGIGLAVVFAALGVAAKSAADNADDKDLPLNE
jgi:hypothetical protein